MSESSRQVGDRSHGLSAHRYHYRASNTRRSLTSLVGVTVTVFFAGACGVGTGSPPLPSPTLPPSPAVASSVANGPSVSPSTSRPAGQIVFENFPNDLGRSQIWIELADGSNVRQLVSSASFDDSPTLSPNGRMVIFHRGLTDSVPAALADPTLLDETLIVNVDGTGLHQVRTGGGRMCDDAVEGDSWSPDGLRIAITRVCFDATAQPTRAGIWIVALDGSGAHEVTANLPSSHLEDHRAGWSPDGRHLAFARLRSVTPERSAIFTVDADGTNIRQVTPWQLDANDPVWSPDGSLIAFNSPAEANQGGEQNIYTIHPDGTGLAQLTANLSANADGTQGTFHPSWAPDGSQILFTHSPGISGFGDLFVIGRDGSGQHTVAATPLAENHADWGTNP